MARTLASLCAVTVCLALVGCKREAPAPVPTPLPKPAVSWKANLLEIEGGPCRPCLLRFNAHFKTVLNAEPTLSIASEQGPEAQVTFASKRVTTAAGRGAALPLAARDFGDLDLKSNRLTLPGSVRVEVAGLAPIEVTLPSLPSSAGAVFGAGKPVVFSDDAPPAKARTAYIALVGKHLVAGPGTHARNVDWVITETLVQRAKKQCTGYRDTRTRQRATVLAISSDSKLTVVDRRTGATVHEVTLAAGPPRCPSVAFGFAAAAERVPQARVEKAALALLDGG